MAEAKNISGLSQFTSDTDLFRAPPLKRPLSFEQTAIWLMAQLDDTGFAYSEQVCLLFPSRFDLDTLKHAQELERDH